MPEGERSGQVWFAALSAIGVLLAGVAAILPFLKAPNTPAPTSPNTSPQPIYVMPAANIPVPAAPPHEIVPGKSEETAEWAPNQQLAGAAPVAEAFDDAAASAVSRPIPTNVGLTLSWRARGEADALVVESVAPSSPFFGRIFANDIIVRVNQSSLTTAEDPALVLTQAYQQLGRLDLLISRGGATYVVSFQ